MLMFAPAVERLQMGLMSTLSGFLRPILSHSAADGALPALFAATTAAIGANAQDLNLARSLWEVPDQLTGVAGTVVTEPVQR